jgi:hypothetical protein
VQVLTSLVLTEGCGGAVLTEQASKQATLSKQHKYLKVLACLLAYGVSKGLV